MLFCRYIMYNFDILSLLPEIIDLPYMTLKQVKQESNYFINNILIIQSYIYLCKKKLLSKENLKMNLIKQDLNMFTEKQHDKHYDICIYLNRNRRGKIKKKERDVLLNQ